MSVRGGDIPALDRSTIEDILNAQTVKTAENSADGAFDWLAAN
jgi:hypothetical protein